MAQALELARADIEAYLRLREAPCYEQELDIVLETRDGTFASYCIAWADFENAVGKTVKVEASRARDGSLRGLMRIITMPDGKVVSLCPQNC